MLVGIVATLLVFMFRFVKMKAITLILIAITRYGKFYNWYLVTINAEKCPLFISSYFIQNNVWVCVGNFSGIHDGTNFYESYFFVSFLTFPRISVLFSLQRIEFSFFYGSANSKLFVSFSLGQFLTVYFWRMLKSNISVSWNLIDCKSTGSKYSYFRKSWVLVLQKFQIES